MTSYSIFRPDSIEADDVHYAQLQTFLHGAARAALDTAELDGDETEEIYAEMYHEERIGWELRAIHPDDLPRFEGRLTAFFNLHNADLTAFVAELLAARDFPDYVTGQDSAWYRAGYLYVFNARGEGIGFWECGEAGERLADEVEAERCGVQAVAYPTHSRDARHVTFDEI